MTIDPDLPLATEESSHSLSTEGQLSVEGLRFVVDMSVVDVQLLLASINTTLEHPQMRSATPSTLAVASEYRRIRDELLTLMVVQIEAGHNQRVLRRSVRRRWTRPTEGGTGGSPESADSSH